MADEEKAIISYNNIIAPTDVFDDLFSNLDSLESRLRKLAKEFNEGLKFINVNDTAQIEKQAIALRKLELAEEKLRIKKEALLIAQKKRKQLTNEELIQAQKERQVQRERVARAKQLAIIQNEQGNTIKSLRAQLSLASAEWAKLTEEEAKNGKRGKQLSRQKLELTKRLKALEKATGDTRRNVGNYTDSLSKLGKTTARVFIGRTAVDFFRKVVTGVKSLIDENKKGSQSLEELDSSLGETSNALTKISVELLKVLAPAITFVSDAIRSFVGLFVDINKGADEFSATSAGLESTINDLNKEMIKEKANVDQLFTSLSNTNEGSKERKELVDQINKQYGQYLPNLLTEKSLQEEIAVAQDLVNEAISKTFLLRAQQATQTDIFTNKATALNDAFNAIKSSAENTGTALGFTVSDFQNFAEELSKNAIASNAFADILSGNFGTIADLTRILNGAENGLGDLASTLVNLQRDGENVIGPFKNLIKETFLYNKAIGDTNASIQALQGDLKTYERNLDINTSKNKDNTKALKDNYSERLKAIEQLQRELSELEIGSIEDRLDRALELEDLRFKEEQKLRQDNLDSFIKLAEEQEKALIEFYGENSKQVIEFREKIGKELLQIESLSQQLSEAQLKASEQRKLDIIADFNLKREKQAKKSVDTAKALIKKDQDKLNKATVDGLKGQQKAIQEEEEALSKQRADRLKNRKEQQEKLSKDIINITKETSKAIQGVFDSEVKAAEDAVSAQVTAVERAESRAQAGLENNLKFEQEQLAQKELQRQQAEKRAKQAAEALALINLTVAAAQNGDPNAVQTGLQQFGVLKGLLAAIGSFYDGTEDTGTVSNPMDSKGGRLAILHNNERVVTAKQNKQLGSMSNETLVKNALLGASISDLKPNYMTLGAAHYNQQTKEVSANNHSDSNIVNLDGLLTELRETRKAIEKKPVVQETITSIIGDVVEVTRKTVASRMTKTEKIKKRL